MAAESNWRRRLRFWEEIASARRFAVYLTPSNVACYGVCKLCFNANLERVGEGQPG